MFFRSAELVGTREAASVSHGTRCPDHGPGRLRIEMCLGGLPLSFRQPLNCIQGAHGPSEMMPYRADCRPRAVALGAARLLRPAPVDFDRHVEEPLLSRGQRRVLHRPASYTVIMSLVAFGAAETVDGIVDRRGPADLAPQIEWKRESLVVTAMAELRPSLAVSRPPPRPMSCAPSLMRSKLTKPSAGGMEASRAARADPSCATRCNPVISGRVVFRGQQW